MSMIPKSGYRFSDQIVLGQRTGMTHQDFV